MVMAGDLEIGLVEDVWKSREIYGLEDELANVVKNTFCEHKSFRCD